MKGCGKREIYNRTEIRRTNRILHWVEENDLRDESGSIPQLRYCPLVETCED